MEYLLSSKRWSRKLSDIEPEKSSIGEISSKISSRPERSGTSRAAVLQGRGDAVLPALVAEQPVEALGLQGQQVGNLERLPDLGEGETAGGRQSGVQLDVVREAAKEGPSTGLFRTSGLAAPTGTARRGHRPRFLPGNRGHGGATTQRRVGAGRGQRKVTTYPKKAHLSNRVKPPSGCGPLPKRWTASG
jgi:hypothetical protein